MGTPIENQPLEPTDDRPADPASVDRMEPPSIDPEVPEADALDQAMAIPIDDDFDR